MATNAKQTIETLLAQADIKIDGNRAWDVHVHNSKLYSRILAGGSLALGESYMDGWWDCKALDEFFNRILRVAVDEKVIRQRHLIFNLFKAKIINLQKKAKAYEIGKKHYDIGNDLYKNMLDKRMVYSCGYWNNAKTLDQAQEAKLELICKKVGLKPGMDVLDIGCGWGSFARYAAEKYKVNVVGVTVSKEQVALGTELCKDFPVDIKLQDYRTLDQKFDRVISIGMFEHVGYKNFRTYMKIVHKCLKPEGLFLLHTIGGNKSVIMNDPWINKYIFPNGMLPSAEQVIKSAEGLFVLEDWHNFGADYDKTLMVWHDNFKRNWDKIKHNYDGRFNRMWTYYLKCCAGGFRSRKNQLWQIVFSKNGVKGGYQSVR